TENDPQATFALRPLDVLRSLHMQQPRLEVEIAKVAVHCVQRGAEIVRSHRDAGRPDGNVHGGKARRERTIEPWLAAHRGRRYLGAWKKCRRAHSVDDDR